MKKSSLVFCILILCQATVFCQSSKRSIDSLLTAYSSLDKFSGNVLVAKKGKLIFHGSYGLADRELKIPHSINTKFRIASLTKQFTAVLVLQLVEAGKLGLHAPISKYLPYYRKDIAEKISIHQLLTHTSGLPEYTQRENFFSEIAVTPYTHKDFVQKFCSDSLLTPPGAGYSYINTGYYLLGCIIEEVTRSTYADVLKKNILDVAGMKNTGVENTMDIIPERARGYTFDSVKYENAGYIDVLSSIFSAGVIYSSTGDLWRWDRALFSGKLLSRKSRELMFTPVMANYGYGVGITRFFAKALKKEMHFIFHQGAINGFRSIMTHVVNDDVLIVLLCNNFDTDLNPISNSIFSILYKQPYTIPGKK